ncbi:FadR/GntR family transcriptional regulator [Streptomyces sp. NPDC057623]|uniref:FadR/GntR family transcriptional regulator n=1 Tax=Streptomyces sp. NPDC057623 TaxID=3346187 RepID=UPI0036AC7E38
MVAEEASGLLVPHARRRYEAVVDSVLELVEARGLRPGDALPTERELADLFGVSRNVLRQAFGVLEERGLLRTVRGSGRYLREAPGDDGKLGARALVEVASIADVLEARTLLEVQVAALACERRTAEQAQTLAVLAGRLTSWEDNLAFHCAVAACTHNFVLERLVRQQAELADELHQRAHYKDPDELQHMRAEHQAIAEAIAARDSAAAQDLVRRHQHRTRRILFSPAER